MNFDAVISAVTEEELSQALEQFSFYHASLATKISSKDSSLSTVSPISKHDAVRKVAELVVVSTPSEIDQAMKLALEKSI